MVNNTVMTVPSCFNPMLFCPRKRTRQIVGRCKTKLRDKRWEQSIFQILSVILLSKLWKNVLISRFVQDCRKGTESYLNSIPFFPSLSLYSLEQLHEWYILSVDLIRIDFKNWLSFIRITIYNLITFCSSFHATF